MSKIYQSPIQNEFADFYAILQDPFGLVIQITKEKHFLMSRRKINASVSNKSRIDPNHSGYVSKIHHRI
ncbi:hypothetical protein ODV97_11715 [Enterococcus gallinarum]|nr:hypothetical protein [Enterococcus gallinarum]